MKKLRLFSLGVSLALAVSALAGKQITLTDITKGEFRSESISAVYPLADGETYAQISSDGKQIVTYS